MYNHRLYFSYWLVNIAVLYFFGMAFSGDVILGNVRYVPLEAAVYAAFWMTFIIWTCWDFVIVRGVKLDNKIGAWVFFLLVNLLAVLTASFFTRFTGLSIHNWLWVILVAAVADTLQRWVWSWLLFK